jgi:hypothetical protein
MSVALAQLPPGKATSDFSGISVPTTVNVVGVPIGALVGVNEVILGVAVMAVPVPGVTVVPLPPHAISTSDAMAAAAAGRFVQAVTLDFFILISAIFENTVYG